MDIASIPRPMIEKADLFDCYGEVAQILDFDAELKMRWSSPDWNSMFWGDP